MNWEIEVKDCFHGGKWLNALEELYGDFCGDKKRRGGGHLLFMWISGQALGSNPLTHVN